jgi:hypothetical protein
VTLTDDVSEERGEPRLRQHRNRPPLYLRPWRKSLPPRVGHPEFIGPTDPAKLQRPGFIQYDENGHPFVVV